MKKQFILFAAGVLIVAGLFILGKTAKPPAPKLPAATASQPLFDVVKFINEAKQKLPAIQQTYLSEIENSVKRGDVQAQKLKLYQGLASFWKDTARVPEAYMYYLAEASKLDNSEKSLTFAARLILEYLRAEPDAAKMNWEAATAISLFEKILEQNPVNTDAKIGLGACYVFGKGRSGDAAGAMKGVGILMDVVQKDSNNLQAQLVLGVGGFYSGQYDKAIPRLLKVTAADPQNFEAVITLAECFSNQGDKQNAIKWYQQAKKIYNNPSHLKDFNAEVDAIIKELSR